MATEYEEIELLERVLLRLGNADTDEKLEDVLKRFLTPVLLKITSPNEGVRTKVIEVLTHVKRRIASRPDVQLPVEALLDQYKSVPNSVFLKNFSVLFITLGFPRLPIERQNVLTPKLILCEENSEKYQDKLFTVLLPILGNIQVPEDAKERDALFQLEDKSLNRSTLLSLMQDVLLLPYGVLEGDIPPGMSPYSFQRVQTNKWNSEQLEKIKCGILKFMNTGLFKECEIFACLVVASADTRFSVQNPATAELSKVCTLLDFSNPSLMAPLYTLFLGNMASDNEYKTTPCCIRLRQKLLQYLVKGYGKSINVPKAMQVIFGSLFGEQTHKKCKVLALQFAERLIKEGPIQIVSKVAKVLLTGFLKIIKSNSTEPIEVQNAANAALTQLAHTCPLTVTQDLEIIHFYFTYLTNAEPELQSSIRDALVAIAKAMSWPASRDDYNEIKLSGQQHLLLALLTEYVDSKLLIVQNVTTTFLSICFPEHFAPARLLLLLVAGERNSLHENVINILYGVPKKDNINYDYFKTVAIEKNSMITDADDATNAKSEATEKIIILPDFKAIMQIVHKNSQQRLNKSPYIVGRTKLPFSLMACEEILDYLRICLWYASGVKSVPRNEKFTLQLKQYIEENYVQSDENEMQQYVNFVRENIIAKRSNINLLCMYDILFATPQLLAKAQVDLIEPLSETLRDVSEILRSHVAQVYGILLAYGCDDTEFNAKISSCLTSFPQMTLEHQHGMLLAIGHSITRKIQSISVLERDAYFNKWSQFNEVIKLTAKMLCESQWLLVSAAVQCIAMIGKEYPIPNVPVEIRYTHNDDEEEEKTSNQFTKFIIFEVIYELLRNSSTRAKIRENAAKCLGSLAIGDREYFVQLNLKKIQSIVKSPKDMGLNIAISEMIVSTLNGHDTTTTVSRDVTERLQCDDKTFEDFVVYLMRLVHDTNPHIRQSCSVWLLGIVKHCNHRSVLINKKSLLQSVFIEFLSDESEFVQDIASRGLGLIYSLSDTNDQNQLTDSLLQQLIGGKRQVNKVSENTEIFPEGMLGKTPIGGNITTYKELCTLASDMNKPDMIYEFMQLVNNNATWTSKVGAAFGMKSLTKDFDEKMEPHLPKIIPRLYRYKYDPTPKIQNSMISIWDSIVKNSNATVEKYYWDILREILENLNCNEWRVRIACCLAVRDLIKSSNGLRLRADNVKEMSKITETGNANQSNDHVPEPELRELWIKLFRVMDDIHEGTRLAAYGTVKVLSKLCVTASSSNHGKSGQLVTSSVLPFLLDTGITHTVVEIRRISIKTVSELIDSSGALIAQQLVNLIPCLLKAVGDQESSKLSYWSTRVSSDADAQETVDTLRSEAAKSTDTMDAVTKCISFIGYNSLEGMTPAIVELSKTSVSLGTKIAIAHFICLIAIHVGKDMTALVGKYLGVCFNGLQDRNVTVRKHYAISIGHLVGIAKEQSIKNLFGKLDKLYMENTSNAAIALSIQYINKRHHELLKDYLDDVLPLIFFAMHEENDDNKSNIELWKDLWNEMSTGVGIGMNITEIINRTEIVLQDASWSRKVQGANCIITIATRLKQTLSEEIRLKLINILLPALQGRTFKGKERLLQALAALCKDIDKPELKNTIAELVIEPTMRECRKKEIYYRTQTLAALGDILEELDVDYFDEVYNMIWHLIEIKDHRSAFDSDDENLPTDHELTAEESNKRAHMLNQLKETVCETLGKAWPKNSIATQQKYQIQFAQSCAVCLKGCTRNVQASLLRALVKFVERLQVFNAVTQRESNEHINREKIAKVDQSAVGVKDVDKICHDILLAVEFSAGLPYTAIKKESLQIILVLIKRLTAANDKVNLKKVKQVFDDNLEKYRKDPAPEVRCRLKNIEEQFSTILI